MCTIELISTGSSESKLLNHDIQPQLRHELKQFIDSREIVSLPNTNVFVKTEVFVELFASTIQLYSPSKR